MNYSLRTVSQIPDSSIVSKTISDFNTSGRQNTYMSSRRLDMERNLRSNMTMSASRSNAKVVFVRVAEYLRGPECAEFQQNLYQQYGQYLHFEYFSDVAGIARVNFATEPVSCVITGYTDRSWAKRFSQNESRHQNFTIYLMCHDRPESEYPDIMKNYSNDVLKPVSGYPDTEQLIRVEYELYSAQYINEVTEKRIRSKFYFKASSNAVLNIYYEEQLGSMVTPYVNPISSSRRFRKTNFFRYRDLKELMLLAKGRKNMKRVHTKKMASSLAINDSIQSIVESRADIAQGVPIESVGDILRTSESEDINYILVTGSHPELEQIRKYCVSQKNTRMLLLDSEKSIRQLKQQMNIFASNGSSTEEGSDRDRIVMSERLLVMVHYDDELTRAEIQQEENFNFHTELVLFISAQQLAAAIWRIHENENYFGLAIIDQNRLSEYQPAIEHAVGFNTPRQIDNFKALLKNNREDGDGILSRHYIEEVDPEKVYLTTPFLLADVSEHSALIHQIFEARNIFYHPARGIIGIKVNIYVRKNRGHLFELLSDTVNRNKRLALVGYQDKQQLEYFVQKTNKTECTLVVTDEREFIEVMRVIKGAENVYVLLISAKERLSFDPQVLKTGLEEDINAFIREIPDNEEDDENCSYLESEEGNYDGINVLRRLSSRSEDVKIVTLPGRALLTVRIPNNEQSKNSILFENRIRKHFKEEVNFRFYENTEEIRDMDKSEEPLQFLIINDSYLEWTKRMATVEAKQKFDIIYYTREPLQPFRQLVEKHRYVRFKLVANHWRSIEDYIVGRASKHSKYQQTFKVTAGQRLHLILASRNRKVEELLAQMAVQENNEIAKRCIYYYHDLKDLNDLRKLLTTVTKGQLCFLILDENDGRNREYEVGNILSNYATNFRQIIISSEEKRYAEHERTAAVVFNEEEAAEYIAMFEFVELFERFLASSGSVINNNGERESNSVFKSQNSRPQSPASIKESIRSNHSEHELQTIDQVMSSNEVKIISEPAIANQQQKGPPAANLQVRLSKTYIFEPEMSTMMSRPDQPCMPCPKPQLKPKIERKDSEGISKQTASVKAQPAHLPPTPPKTPNSNSQKQSSSDGSKPRPSAIASRPPLPVNSSKPSQISQNSRKSSRPLLAESSRSSSESGIKSTIAVYYLESSPSIERIVEYISNNSTGAQVFNYPMTSMEEVDANLGQNVVDRSLLLISGSRKENEFALKLQAKYPQLRVYRNPTGDALTELSVVFQLGWEYKLLALPYCNPALPTNILTADRINILLPQDIVSNSGYQLDSNGLYAKSTYRSLAELCDRVDTSPHSDYFVVLVQQEDLPNIWNLPFRNPNCRLLVLVSSITVREWFQWHGDMFWLYADSKADMVLDELDKLGSDLTKLKIVPSNKQSISHALYYTEEQKDINSLELLHYRKRQYTSQNDLKLKSETKTANELSYQLLSDSGQVFVKPLSTVMFARTTSHWSSAAKSNQMRVPYSQILDIRDFIELHQLRRYLTPLLITGYLPQDEVELLRLQTEFPTIQLLKAAQKQDRSDQSRISKVSIGIQEATPPSPSSAVINQRFLVESEKQPSVQRIPARVIQHQRPPPPIQNSIVLPSPPTPIPSKLAAPPKAQTVDNGTDSQPLLVQQSVQTSILAQSRGPPHQSHGPHLSMHSRMQQTSSLASQTSSPRMIPSSSQPAQSSSSSSSQAPIYQLINQAIQANDKAALGIYYLCEWLPVKADRFMKHVNLHELLDAFRQQPSQLMIIFAEKDMLHRLPKSLVASQRVRLVAVADEPCPESLLWLRVADLQDVQNHIRQSIDARTQTQPRAPPISTAIGTDGKQPFDILIASKGVFSSEDSNKVTREELTTIGNIKYVDRTELLDSVVGPRSNPIVLVLDGLRQDSQPIQVVYDTDGGAKLSMLRPNARVLRSAEQLKQFLLDNPAPKAKSPPHQNRKKILNTVNMKLSRQPLSPSHMQPTSSSSLRRHSAKIEIRVTRPSETPKQGPQSSLRSDAVKSSPYNGDIRQLPLAAEEMENMWIDDALIRFLPILNGDIMRILIPSPSKELRQMLARSLPTLIIVKYMNLDYINSYLNSHPTYPTIVLLDDDLTERAEQLQHLHSNLRIIQLGKRDFQPLGVSLNVETDNEAEYLMRRLMEQNALVDLASNKYSDAPPTEFGASRAGLLPITDSSQKIFVLYDPQRNRLIMDSINRSAGESVLFVPYKTKSQAYEYIEKLGTDDLALLICNDDDIRHLQEFPSNCPHLYYIRHISNRMRPAAGFGALSDRVLFTGYTLQAVSGFICKLLINSFNKVGRKPKTFRNTRLQVTRIRSSEVRRVQVVDEQKRYRRHYAPSTFGTAARFEYYDDKYVPTEESTRDRVSYYDSRPFSSRDRGKLRMKSPSVRNHYAPSTEYQ